MSMTGDFLQDFVDQLDKDGVHYLIVLGVPGEEYTRVNVSAGSSPKEKHDLVRSAVEVSEEQGWCE